MRQQLVLVISLFLFFGIEVQGCANSSNVMSKSNYLLFQKKLRTAVFYYDLVSLINILSFGVCCSDEDLARIAKMLSELEVKQSPLIPLLREKLLTIKEKRGASPEN